MNINKDENIITIIKYEGKFHWFTAFKEMWVLDRIKWINDFVTSGVSGVNINDHQERYNIAIINKNNIADFIQHLKDDGYMLKKDEIASEFYERLSSKTTWWDIHDLLPDLFIDFDALRLYSEYIESMHYEQYVPDGWSGELKDFCEELILPSNEMFWVKNGVDYRKNIILQG